MALLLFLSFIIFLLIGIPVSYSLGLSCLIYFLGSDIPLIAFAQKNV